MLDITVTLISSFVLHRDYIGFAPEHLLGVHNNLIIKWMRQFDLSKQIFGTLLAKLNFTQDLRPKRPKS